MAFDLTIAADPPGERQIGQLSPEWVRVAWQAGHRRGRARPGPSSGPAAPFDSPQVESGRGRVGRTDRRLDVDQPHAVLPAWAGGQALEGLALEPGGKNRLQEPARRAHLLGRRQVDRAVEPDDSSVRADRVALVGPLERRGEIVRDRGAAGVVVLEDAGGRARRTAGSGGGRVQVEQVVVRKLLAVEHRGCSRGSGRVRPGQLKARLLVGVLAVTQSSGGRGH